MILLGTMLVTYPIILLGAKCPQCIPQFKIYDPLTFFFGTGFAFIGCLLVFYPGLAWLRRKLEKGKGD